ncbi:MAG TPA: DsbE family thiol:disulfide interchange protein [Sphingomicrobium sp.]|jgi:cytochrome c biogenesis protein CcmG, thiol:disulfide interchange protein DsbE|nr:DsbE family thiol:disulfide interchange protein [Sphingomicrobium sp.]
MSRAVRFLPLLVLLGFVAFVAWRLMNPADTVIRSRLAGQPVPQFALPPAVPGRAALSSADLATGKPRLVNIFASWCVPCIAEAPVLGELERRGVAIDGIAIRDRPEDVADFLARHGNPYQRIGADLQSRVQIALGSSGVPESFVVDGGGIIRYHHIGAIMPQDVPVVLAELEKAK